MLRQRRISRSLVAILFLTFLQTIVSPIFNVASPKAQASTLYANVSDFQQYTNWQGVNYNHTPYQTSSGTTPIASNGAAINLTQNVGSQSGFLWNTKTFSYDNDFTVNASYFLGTGNPDGADLIAFVMRPIGDWPNDGIAGSSTGGVPGWANGEIRAIFDTYQNAGEMANDHLTVQATKLDGTGTTYTYTNSEIGVPLKDASGNTVNDVEDNVTHDYTISWTAATRTFSVYAGNASNSLIYSTVITTAQMDATTFSFGWVGFTGGAYNYQSVQNVNYHVGPSAITSSASDTTVTDGSSVTWTASYTSTEGTPTTRWEYSTDGGTTWTTTGVTTNTYTFTATRALTQRKYRFYVSTTGAGATFSRTTSPATLTVLPPALFSDTDTALTTSGTKYAIISNSNTLIPGTISTVSLEAWIKPSTTCDSAVACTIMTIDKSFLVQVVSGKIRYYIGSGSAYCDGGVGKDAANALTPGGQWTHVGLVRVNANVKIYINGTLRSDLTSSCSPTTQAANTNAFVIGAKGLNSEPFVGSIDEVRIWSLDRTSNMASDMNSNETSTSGLLNYWNFNEGSGTTAYNQVPSATSASDLTISDSSIWDAPVVSDQVTSSAYTVRNFYRTYITATGGWKVPSGSKTVSALVVGGGGGGGWNSGSGGGGGAFTLVTPLQISGIVAVKVGAGGRGGQGARLGTSAPAVPTYDPTSGLSSQFSSYSVSGGSRGSVYNVSCTGCGDGIGTMTGTSGSGGAGAPASGSDAYGGGAGYSSSIGGSVQIYSAGGGGGGWASNGGAPGGATTGARGQGVSTLPGSGGGTATSDKGVSALPNTGSGGGASAAYVDAGNGGSGIVIVRWITSSVPTYTKPVNAYLNVGMTETFTTNVQSDSATVGLTRTFRWESTTTGANGTFTLIKQGNGATNAAFSWVPTDTSTSGSNYLYRLIVTDSDTAGLFITDSSTAFAVINRTLVMTGVSVIKKAINLSRSDTYAVTFGTPAYSATLTPVISGITLDTSTINSPVIRIADTATVGTYYETLTVTDSVSASVAIPLTITITAPPNLLNTSEIVANDLILNLDAGNSASLIADSGTATTGKTWNDLSGGKNNGATGAGVNTGALGGTSCTAPTFTSSNAGALTFSPSTNNCYYVSSLNPTNIRNNYTVEAWFKTSTTLSGTVGIISQSALPTNAPFFLTIGTNNGSALYVSFWDNTSNTLKLANCGYTPTVGVWTNIAGTYDGTTMSTYINGQLLCSTPITAYSPSGSANNAGLIIGNAGNGASSGTFPGSIATIRVYKKALTSAQLLTNYSATKSRFDDSNINTLNPSKKYGDRLLDSFTVTSGSDTNTIALAVGSRAGLVWDTTTISSVASLTLQESLTVNSYLDTVTVTDALGQSTYLPLQITVSKADTLTVTMTALTSVIYNGLPITIYPKPVITGLKWTDTATTLSRFSSAIYTETTTVPTNADTYTVRGSIPTFSLGSLNNYAGIKYDTSTAVVSKANQRPLNIYMYGGVVGSPYLIWLQGGNGTGAVNESLTGVSTLSGCAISNHYLTATEQKQGYCEVRVVKDGDQNYWSETQTVQLYFMAYINGQPTGVVGSGNGIGINGVTSYTLDTTAPPSITGLSTLTLSIAGGGTFTITGTGFNASGLTVKFWRNKIVVPTGSTSTTITLNVSDIGAAGATTGRVTVITTNGQDFSTDTLTITP